MPVDLLLDLDDDVLARIQLKAELGGITAVEYVTRILMDLVDMPYVSPDPATADLIRPMTHLDLRAE